MVYILKKKRLIKNKKNVTTKKTLDHTFHNVFSLWKTPSDTAKERKGRRKKKKKKPSDLFTTNSARRKKKPCATLEIRSVGHRHPLLSFSGAFFSLSLSFSLSFCCFVLVLKFPCDFGISFPCFREFTEYPRSVLRLKSSRVML